MKTKLIFAVMAMILVLPLSMMAQDGSHKLKKNQDEIVIATNMECNGCKTEIENALSFEKGVVEVESDLATKNVRIIYKTKKNNAENLVACIQKAGYQAKLIKKSCYEETDSGTQKCEGNGTKKKGCCDKKE